MSERDPDLRQLLSDSFNDSELRSLCFDLKIEYEDLPGLTRSDKARELISYARRYGRMADLLAACRAHRPHARWPQPAGVSPVASRGAPRISRVATLIVAAIIVAAALGVLAAQGGLVGPGSVPFRYQVRVRSAVSGKPISNVNVTLETVAGSSQDAYTDANGLVMFPLSSSLRGSAARLIIDSPGYERFVQNSTLQDGGLPEEVQLQAKP
jgi:hypothetical protein